MILQFKQDHGIYRAGAVVDYPHDGAADVLVRRGLAAPAAVPIGSTSTTATTMLTNMELHSEAPQPKPKTKPKPKKKKR